MLTDFKSKLTLILVTALTVIVCAPSAAHAQRFGSWGPAVNVDPDRTIGINTPFNDGCPIEGPDGSMLYIATN
ncbi:hypothetical protein BH18VER1_BH18VER1_06890 [soil metagenome]